MSITCLLRIIDPLIWNATWLFSQDLLADIKADWVIRVMASLDNELDRITAITSVDVVVRDSPGKENNPVPGKRNRFLDLFF